MIQYHEYSALDTFNLRLPECDDSLGPDECGCQGAGAIVCAVHLTQLEQDLETIADKLNVLITAANLGSADEDAIAAMAMAAFHVAGRLLGPEPQLYVNAYAVDRNYGGPEEGGWWYDNGDPLASVPVRTNTDEELARRLIFASFGQQYGFDTQGLPIERKSGRRRYSVNGEPDLVVTLERHPARPWPAVTPHYE